MPMPSSEHRNDTGNFMSYIRWRTYVCIVEHRGGGRSPKVLLPWRARVVLESKVLDPTRPDPTHEFQTRPTNSIKNSDLTWPHPNLRIQYRDSLSCFVAIWIIWSITETGQENGFVESFTYDQTARLKSKQRKNIIHKSWSHWWDLTA